MDSNNIATNNLTIITTKPSNIFSLNQSPLSIYQKYGHITRCGSALITICGTEAEHNTFTIIEGQAFYIPSGYVHHIENLNKISTTELIIGFSHELPEEFSYSSAFSAISDAVLGNTFQLPSNVWKDIIKRGKETLIRKIERIINIDNDKKYIYPNKYKFDFEKMSPSLIVPEGSAKIPSKTYWPILENISMCSLSISSTGMVEPHWHSQNS